LKQIGVDAITVVTGGEHFQDIGKYLNDMHRDLNIPCYAQAEAGGIAQALGLTKHFVGRDNVAVILGDNVFEGNFSEEASRFESSSYDAEFFLKEVPDPERFGVAKIKDGIITEIKEKPKKPKSNLAVTGLYFFRPSVYDVIRRLKPSARGEIEITDVNSHYVRRNQAYYLILEGFWSDAGTVESRKRCEEFVRNGLERQVIARLPESSRKTLPAELQ
jgi:glucose-1-phosphate thymidylyltransferase